MEENKFTRPLADRMRPQNFDEFVGQQHIIGNEKILRKAVEAKKIPSMIFWGPPGSGKTTLARIIARQVGAEFVELSATASGVKEIRTIFESATQLKRLGTQTILFIDEIHRFNKSQQDAFLPYVENGTVILIGATTENPSFEVNKALLSRCKVFVLNLLTASDMETIIKRALANKEKGLGLVKNNLTEDDIKLISNLAGGDARSALNALELAIENKISVKEAFQKSHLIYDRAGDEHYNIISALHKSMRGGDANAALYWLARMLGGGEDPLYVARRVVRFASEDIGLANSLALPQALAAYDACHYLGMPECSVNLAQAVVYMAKSKKSTELYKGYLAAAEDAKNFPEEPVPMHLRNTPIKVEGVGYFPDKLKGKKYFKD